MKIEINNFGPIDHLIFDMDKDLHLIYGQNAVGKSYATYCIYALIKNIKNAFNQAAIFLIQKNETISSQINTFSTQIIHDFKNSDKNKINITKQIHELIEKIYEDVILKEIENSFLNTFSNLKNLKNTFSNKNFEIIIDNSKDNNLEKIVIYFNKSKLEVKFFMDLYPVQISKNNQIYSIEVNKINRLDNNADIDKVISTLNYWIWDAFKITSFTLFYIPIRDVYYLPASRSGLYHSLNSFAPILAELSQYRHSLKQNMIPLPSLTEPIADYFLDLSTANSNNINTEFAEIVTELEKSILKGSINYDNKSKKIIYTPNSTNLKLNLAQASSMVSEISPLLVYFKHILNFKHGRSSQREQEKDIMFIEEPEAHLHPEIQVKLIEIFAKISKMNIKIFITSHSNYMFNKLNNMLLNGDVDKDKIAVYHLIQGENGSYQNPDMQVSPDGINDDNFNAISRQLYEERMKIYDKD
jgi:predicted ATPase